MSKRYGRNQKRRHRERIAALESGLARMGEMYNRDVKGLRQTLDDARRERDGIVETIRRRLPYSAMLPPRAIGGPGGHFRYATDDVRAVIREAESAIGDMSCSTVTVDLHALEAAIHDNLATLEREVHVRLADRAMRYAVSSAALAQSAHRSAIEHEIARTVARAMADAL